ncbi:CRISPR-associated endonuclease Cas1, subtype II/NMENI [Coriobacteriaceae bacterium BV3Ac1]|nr:type II CRISPR-associated endonuclease Cas1 [Olegusella massiliensis]ERL12388.1 CRISPR-associated endonuclease Cas1, subtype II/NMENI [Coriobacteriaceae bacterium BV3Ac1]
MGFRAVCIESRAKCSYSGGYLVVTTGDVTTKIHLSEISTLTFGTTQVYVSGYLMAELAQNKIPVSFCNEKRFPEAVSLPLHGSYNCLEGVENQLSWSLPSKKRLWQKVIRHKILKQAEVLALLEIPAGEQRLKQYAEEVRSGDPTNREATAAALYFASLFGADFTRDSENWINASLNYGYSVLLSQVSRELISHGYLTHVGICHKGRNNHWNFACDLMEPFRPFIDYLIVSSGLDDFNKPMRCLLIDSLSHLVNYRDGTYKMASVVKMYVKDCVDCLDRKLSADDIEIYEVQ